MADSLLQDPPKDPPKDPPQDPPKDPPQDPPAGDRPEWLPEKFKTAEDMAKSYGELEGKLSGKVDELRTEIEQERLKDRPESAGEYKLPDGIVEGEAVDNDMLKWWAETAFENGYSQEKFEEGIEIYRKAIVGEPQDMDAERKALGDNAEDRIKAVSLFAAKTFGDEFLPDIARLMETAGGVKVLEKVIELAKDTPTIKDDPIAGITQDKLREMQQDPRYWKDKDPAFIKQVEEGYAKLYG